MTVTAHPDTTVKTFTTVYMTGVGRDEAWTLFNN